MTLLLGPRCIYILVALALGLTFRRWRGRTPANQMSMVIGFLPTFLLSGFTISHSNMPTWLQMITMHCPRYYVRAVKEICLEGTGLSFLGTETLVTGRGWGSQGSGGGRSFKKELR